MAFDDLAAWGVDTTSVDADNKDENLNESVFGANFFTAAFDDNLNDYVTSPNHVGFDNDGFKLMGKNHDGAEDAFGNSWIL
mmetsp:Transcript_2970/g.6448  ORF Transcript_2970/g.6448 Transcript_2970/m.6448 type:complete len:81 (-) Transcript_2970:54-296(-)